MAHYMQNQLSFEKIKDLGREYFFILLSLQAPCALLGDIFSVVGGIFPEKNMVTKSD
jgi:hypothetical protein